MLCAFFMNNAAQFLNFDDELLISPNDTSSFYSLESEQYVKALFSDAPAVNVVKENERRL